MTCRWDRDAEKHLLREHRTDCTTNGCLGCLPCTHDHDGNPVRHCRTRRRCTSHLPWGQYACSGCLAKIRSNLTRITDALALMPAEAEVAGINSEAASYAGPSAHPGSAYARRRHSALNGRPFEDPDQADPWQMLGERERMIREDLGHDWRLVSPTLAETCDYLTSVLTDLARDEGQTLIVADLLSESRRLAEHLESVLRDSRRPERGAPCRSCATPAPRLQLVRAHWCDDADCEREHDTTEDGDRWVCPADRSHWWRPSDYRRWVYADAREPESRGA